MLDKYQDIQGQFDSGEKKFTSNLNQFSGAINEIENHATEVRDDLKNVNIVISDIDKQFEEKTGITNAKDISFLWGAVAVQCAR